jgi:hypothetical protein
MARLHHFHGAAILVGTAIGSAALLVAAMSSAGPAGAVARSSTQLPHLPAAAASPIPSPGAASASGLRRSLGGLPSGLRADTGPQLVTAQKSVFWSGYELVGSEFTGVAADWVVPAIQKSTGDTFSSEWIGIGGSGVIQTLIQCGVIAGEENGVITYHPFWQLYPSPVNLMQTPMSPGDLMVAVITESSPGVWQIRLGDQTKGWLLDKYVDWSGTDITSAEWIMERPTIKVVTGEYGLADFGTMRFTHLAVRAADPTVLSWVDETLIYSYVSNKDLAVAGPLHTSPTTGVYFTISYTGPTPEAGYDLVGSDGGVFVFPTGTTFGFFGSLPGIGVKVNDIVGMVPTVTDKGYFLVGSDGGVFAFGTAPYLGSLPGEHIVPKAPITGIVAADTDKGYFLVGRDGGVFSFGTVPFLGSLPGQGKSVDNIIGIAALASGKGYWLVGATGQVYTFGTAAWMGSAVNSPSPVAAIAGTETGSGYWIVLQNGTVDHFGTAIPFGTLPSLKVTPAQPIIGIVPGNNDFGYWLIGDDGGVFGFGQGGYVGSLPAVGVHVTNIVGAVPT